MEASPKWHSGAREFVILLVIVSANAMVDIPAISRSDSTVNGFLTTKESWIMSDGQPMLLRGANFRGYNWCYSAVCETIHSETDYQNMKAWGFNVVRLPISWQQIEPTRGIYDTVFLSRFVDRDISWAKKHGLYIVLDMQQHKWNWKWGGNGAPDWAVAEYPATEEGRLRAVEDFWKNKTLVDSFSSMWKYIASRYSNEQTIAGYDILNEPATMFANSSAAFAAGRWDTVQRFNELVVDQIRSVDTNHIIFVEPMIAPWPSPVPSTAVPFNRPNVVWAPHFYTWVYAGYGADWNRGRPYLSDNVTLLKQYLTWINDKFTVDFHQPMWIGEFGTPMSLAGSDMWTRDSVQLLEQNRLGWAWWTYWNSPQYFDDFSLLNPDGTQRLNILQYLIQTNQTSTATPSTSISTSSTTQTSTQSSDSQATNSTSTTEPTSATNTTQSVTSTLISPTTSSTTLTSTTQNREGIVLRGLQTAHNATTLQRPT